MVVGCTDPDVERCIISCENDQQYALKFKSGKSFSVPSNVLHRSGLLSGVVEEVEPDQDCTCVVAQARIESWLDYISRGEADTSLSEESALSALLVRCFAVGWSFATCTESIRLEKQGEYFACRNLYFVGTLQYVLQHWFQQNLGLYWHMQAQLCTDPVDPWSRQTCAQQVDKK